MAVIINFIKKHRIEILLQIVLLVIAAVSYGLTITNNYPLVDFDEATYAKVVVDTLESGEVLSFTLSGNDWFEKPPLYLWFAMGTTKIFGAEEFAFRLPSVLFALLTLWLVYLIVKLLTGSQLASAAAFLILLFSPTFFVFAREIRLDSGVIMSMLAALYFFMKGWKNEKFYFWIAPAIAIGFLFKHVVAFLIIPIILIYSVFYKQWTWIKSKHLWAGIVASIVILAPWHILQTIRFGSDFWKVYFLEHIFQRVISTITGARDFFDHVDFLWQFYNPWLWVLFLIIFILLAIDVSKQLRSNVPWKYLFAPLLSALLILVIFTLVKTHIAPYIMPMFPFLAMFIALSLHYFYNNFKRIQIVLPIIVLIFIIIGAVYSFIMIDTTVIISNYDEKKAGLIYKESQLISPGPLYTLDWPYYQTLHYYGDTDYIEYIDIRERVGDNLKAPFYMVTNENILTWFSKDGRTVLNGYEYLKVLYMGDFLFLLYSDQNLTLPSFGIQ